MARPYREATIESECVVPSLEFPRNIDHAWLSLAYAIHVRPFVPHGNGMTTPGAIAQIEAVRGNRWLFRVSDLYSWTDGEPLVAAEIVHALKRGEKLSGLRLFGDIREAGSCAVMVEQRDDVAISEDLLASPLFTITPSCRVAAQTKRRPSLATCGAWQIEQASPDLRLMIFRRRLDVPGSHADAPDRVIVRVTPDREVGVRLLETGHLSLTCPLGANPAVFEAARQWNCVSNGVVNLGMILRPYPQSALARDFESLDAISENIDRQTLSTVSGGTLVPMHHFAALFSGQNVGNPGSTEPAYGCSKARYSNARKIELRYAAYQPNLQIATAIREQLYRTLGIESTLVETSYQDYIGRVFPKAAGLSLEVIQPSLPFDQMSRLWHFVEGTTSGRARHIFKPGGEDTGKDALEPPIAIPILQCVSTAMSSMQPYKTRRPVTCEALLDWDQL